MDWCCDKRKALEKRNTAKEETKVSGKNHGFFSFLIKNHAATTTVDHGIHMIYR